MGGIKNLNQAQIEGLRFLPRRHYRLCGTAVIGNEPLRVRKCQNCLLTPKRPENGVARICCFQKIIDDR